MAVYTPGRRRAILLLVLTSLLLITIDLRGNALLDTARDGFDRAMRPLEDAADVVARPVRNAWQGITEYDDLEADNDRLRAEIDAMRTNDIVARSIIDSYRRLLGMEDLETPGNFDRIIASVIGQSPNNLDLIIEINKGSSSGIRVGMPVVNPAGALIGKVTAPVTSDRARVMLITDPNYADPRQDRPSGATSRGCVDHHDGSGRRRCAHHGDGCDTTDDHRCADIVVNRSGSDDDVARSPARDRTDGRPWRR